MIDEEIRFMLRKQWYEVRTPPSVDYRLIGFGRVLVLIGWAVVAGLITEGAK